MERIALQKLIDWNNNKRKKPLIIWGARQVGKTYLAKELFAEKYYKSSYIYIDCKKRMKSASSVPIPLMQKKLLNTSHCVKESRSIKRPC